MQRSAQHTARVLVCATAAALPVALVTGCSLGSSELSGADTKSATHSAPASSPSGPASPSPAPGRYAQLPRACTAIPQRTVKAMVPKAKTAKGEATESSDTDARDNCSWNGLNGYQYRWLAVSLQRFDSVPGIGSAQAQATKRYQDQVGEAQAAKGAGSEATRGVGDQATTVTTKVTKDKNTYQEVTVVAHTGNAVVVIDYNGAGFEGAKTPAAADLRKDAVSAAKETVAAVAAANT
jgi:hypothetical protein